MGTFRLMIALPMLLAVVACGGGEPAYEEPAAAAEPTASDSVVQQLQADCAGAADAIAARQAETSLYDRLGGREAIAAVIADVVRRHRENETIRHLMDGDDDGRLISQVTDFISQAAGGDVQAAMQAAGAGEPEIQEIT